MFARLKFESGVHRVQRVPVTESGGRIHTSAATVAVLPEAEEVDVQIDDKDLRIDVYRSSGPGGQSVNTTDSAVRITHLPTGLVVIQQDEKSQHKNKAKALKVLRTRLYELERERLASERAGARKSMVGSGDRSERIRTYNFPQGRVTDHRINLTLHRLPEILEGQLDELIGALIAEDEAERLASLDEQCVKPCAAAAARLAAVSDTAAPRCRIADGPCARRSSARRCCCTGCDDPAPAASTRCSSAACAHEPVAYITGRRAFWTIELEVGPGALVPRPDSETLIEAAVAHFGDAGPARILDLGTGPGTLLLAALDQWPEATGLGVDASEAALAYARRNAEAARAEFRLGDWGEGIDERFDLILCNPPYVEARPTLPADVADFEPPRRCSPAATGSTPIARSRPQLARLLAPGGIVCLEIGAGQEKAVAALMAARGVHDQSHEATLKGSSGASF